jgi:hypothetical protein
VLTRDEQQELQVQKRTSPPSKVVHDAILSEGREDLKRPGSVLFWEPSWQPLVSRFGYAIGSLIVVLGRQRLFTENALTAVLPLMHERNGSAFLNMLRLWGVVLAGSPLFAWFALSTNAFDETVRLLPFAEAARFLVIIAGSTETFALVAALNHAQVVAGAGGQGV